MSVCGLSVAPNKLRRVCNSIVRALQVLESALRVMYLGVWVSLPEQVVLRSHIFLHVMVRNECYTVVYGRSGAAGENVYENW